MVHHKRLYKYHLPGRLAGDFLCGYDEAEEGKHQSRTFHIAANLDKMLLESTDHNVSVCSVCLQRYIKSLNLRSA